MRREDVSDGGWSGVKKIEKEKIGKEKEAD